MFNKIKKMIIIKFNKRIIKMIKNIFNKIKKMIIIKFNKRIIKMIKI